MEIIVSDFSMTHHEFQLIYCHDFDIMGVLMTDIAELFNIPFKIY